MLAANRRRQAGTEQRRRQTDAPTPRGKENDAKKREARGDTAMQDTTQLCVWISLTSLFDRQLRGVVASLLRLVSIST